MFHILQIIDKAFKTLIPILALCNKPNIQYSKFKPVLIKIFEFSGLVNKIHEYLIFKLESTIKSRFI